MFVHTAVTGTLPTMANKTEYIRQLDSILSQYRKRFEEQIWDAHQDGTQVDDRFFRGAMCSYVFWLEDTIEKHFQVGPTQSKWDLNDWKARRKTFLIGETGFSREQS